MSSIEQYGVDLLTDVWLEDSGALLAGATLPDRDLSVTWTVTEAAGETTHHQVFSGGRLVWRPGAAPQSADLHLRQPLGAHIAMLTRSGNGDDIMGATEVVDDRTGGAGPPAPLDEVVVDWGADLPVVPTAAELVVQQVLVASPFGDVSTSYRFARGRVVEASIGSLGSPDIFVRRTYGDALAERSGALDLIESVVGGQVIGDFKKVATFLGIYDSDECRRAREALTTPYLGAQAVLGELLASPGWSLIAARLSGTTPIRSVP